MKDPGKFFENNLVNSLHLMEAASEDRGGAFRALLHRGGLPLQ